MRARDIQQVATKLDYAELDEHDKECFGSNAAKNFGVKPTLQSRM